MPAPDTWRLTYGSTDLSFGGLDDVATFGEAPELGSVDIVVEDQDRPRADGRTFGYDYFSGRTITFPSLLIRGADAAEVRRKAQQLEAAWRADEVRGTPNATATLTIGDRVVFGRPRRFQRADAELLDGLSIAQADFACATPDFFGAAVTSIRADYSPVLGGGLVSPLKAPLSTTRSADRSLTLRCSSPMPAYPVVTIGGPITNPEVVVAGAFSFRLLTRIAAGETVTIDATPWARSVVRSNGTSAAGYLDRSSTRLAKARIPAGSYAFTLRGIDTTGTSWASVSWRDRYSTL